MRAIAEKNFSCICKIQSLKNRKCYIGSALNYKTRMRHHIWHLKKNTHHSIYLQNHVNKYGLKDIVFEVLSICDSNELIKKEQFYIDLFTPEFNISKYAYSTLGVKCSEDKKEKLRKIHTGRKATPQAVEANRQGQIKRHLVPLPKSFGIAVSKGLRESKLWQQVVHSEEFRAKQVYAQKTKKEIICITNNTIYPSIRAAAKELNIMHISISRVCRGMIPKTHGLFFKFI